MAGKTILSDDEDEIEVEEDEREEPDGEELGPRNRLVVDDDEEEDEDGQDEYEKDGFIVDDIDDEEQDGEEEEEDKADSDVERHRKKKRKKRESEKNFVLDEDDYELLQDNNVGYRRPKESKKFKRLKKARADADEGQSGFSDEEEYDGTGMGGGRAEDKIERSLFDDDEGPLLEDIAEEDQQLEEDRDIGEEEDEMADFIVDEHGERTRRRKVNKKKYRQAPGVSSTAIQEAHDIFGDVDELLMQRKSELQEIKRYAEVDEQGEIRLEDEFEPFILSEKYMTKNDDCIREIDIPERMQISEKSTGPPPTDGVSIDDESSWIFNQLATGMIPLFSKEGHELPVCRDDIVRFLEFLHVQKLDVPFIAMYRMEECQSLFLDSEPQDDKDNQQKDDKDNQKKDEPKPPLRWHKALWAILELDRKWLLLQKRKSALQLYYNKRFEEERGIYDETRLHLNQKLFDSVTKSLEVAESEREIDDVDSKFNLHFPPCDVGVGEGKGKFKRPNRKSQYSICCKSGLWEVASKFGYSSEEFGLLISLEQMRTDELEDAKETPEEVASRFTCAMFENPQAVLRGARLMSAAEISCEPCVRRHVRSIFMDNAVLSTNPTADGNLAIDSHHQFAGIKWLKGKPVTKFDDAQWLLIQKAEEEKLIQVSIKLPVSIHDQLINDAYTYYLSDGVSKSAQLWNEQRKQIINDAFDGLLLPSMAKEARTLLTSRAKNCLLMEYGRHLWDKVSVAPYQKKDQDVDSSYYYEGASRVMACCWGPPATTFVMLDSSGEVLDILYASFISIRGQNDIDQQRKKSDQQRVAKFMTDHQPNVIVLGAVNLTCTQIRENLFEIIFKMVEETPRDVGHEMDGITVVYADETVPRLYENSRISSEQLQSQSGIVKRAVALGRYLQNPLAMVATLCGPAKEVLSWKLTPLESFLTPDEKYSMVEQIMVDVTNQVGLDVNLAISHEWLFAPLQFISGLGPRKAASLQRSLVRNSSIYTRKDLLNHGLGRKVFVNAVGFLRVRQSGNAANSSQYIDLLDDTRIHPESYGLAQELAKDIYTADGQDVNDEDLLEMAIEHMRENPNLLKKSVDVDAYARTRNFENKKDTLNHIRLELIQGFQDWRKPYVEPNKVEQLYMITGETEETLSKGKIVQATVSRVQPQVAICALDSGLTGLLVGEDFGDDHRDNDLTEKLNEGDILTCKIKSIQSQKNHQYKVFLSCKESDLRNERSQNKENMDPYYHEDVDNLENEKEKARKAKELAKKHFKSRMIVHPRFQNITADEAMEMLADKESGDSIIRPSSRGPRYLTLTLKIYDGVYAHKDIIEGGKENKDITSVLRLGKKLKIGDDVFEDLDEVMDRYVDPLVAHLKTMFAYRKFRDGGKSEIDECLRKEKNENPSRIVYSFGISHEHPGTFILTYIRSSNPHHEYVGLYPKGFKFRKRMFEEIDRLVAYFQRHIDDPLDAGPSIRSVAAMVPMRSPAGSGSGGWKGQSGDRERMGGSNYRNGSSHNNVHPSGLPRHYGGGRGWGRGGGSCNRGNQGGNGRSKDGEELWGSSISGSKISCVQSQVGGSSAGWGSGW